MFANSSAHSLTLATVVFCLCACMYTVWPADLLTMSRGISWLAYVGMCWCLQRGGGPTINHLWSPTLRFGTLMTETNRSQQHVSTNLHKRNIHILSMWYLLGFYTSSTFIDYSSGFRSFRRQWASFQRILAHDKMIHSKTLNQFFN